MSKNDPKYHWFDRIQQRLATLEEAVKPKEGVTFLFGQPVKELLDHARTISDLKREIAGLRELLDHTSTGSVCAPSPQPDETVPLQARLDTADEVIRNQDAQIADLKDKLFSREAEIDYLRAAAPVTWKTHNAVVDGLKTQLHSMTADRDAQKKWRLKWKDRARSARAGLVNFNATHNWHMGEDHELD